MKDLSYKTAMSRKGLSLPAQLFKPYLIGDCLDFGCGRGTDAEILGMDRFDSHFFPERLVRKYDVITMIYVLNVTKYPEEVLKIAKAYLKPAGLLMVACRTLGEIKRQARISGWEPYGHGWITNSGTYQRGYSKDFLVEIVGDQVVKSGGGKFTYVIARK